MKKKTFTIVELIIVMSIIGVMFLMTKKLFTSENRIYYEGEACINRVFDEVKEVQQAALYSNIRSFSGINALTNFRPDRYSVFFAQPRLERTAGTIKKVDIRWFSGQALQAFSTPGTYLTWVTTSGTANTDTLLSWISFIRGTGEITNAFQQAIFNTSNIEQTIFKLRYIPFGRGVTYLTGSFSGYGYARQPLKNCSIGEAFVSMYIPSNNASEVNTPTLTVAFQNSYSDYPAKMMIKQSRESDYSYLNYYSLTGSVNFFVCNKKVQCRETHRIFFDSRINNMFLQKCATYSANRECSAWQGGNIN